MPYIVQFVLLRMILKNVGGGYILIGVEEESGIAKRPVVGLSASKIASIQKEMIGYNNLINPVYHPKLFIETVDGLSLSSRKEIFSGYLSYYGISVPVYYQPSKYSPPFPLPSLKYVAC